MSDTTFCPIQYTNLTSTLPFDMKNKINMMYYLYNYYVMSYDNY